MELQTIERRLANVNVNYTQQQQHRHHNASSLHHRVNASQQGVTPASAAVRLRHTRLRLLNELDDDLPVSSTSAGAGGRTQNDDATTVASTSTAAAQSQAAAAASSLASRRRREVLAEFRRRAALTLRQRMPVVRDVNKIDRYSRTAFPVLFVVFNVAYWVYYITEK